MRHRPPTPARARVPRLVRLLPFATACLIGLAARAADAPPGPVLHLADGGSTPGELKDSDRPGVLRWQSPPFVAPFDFDVRGVAAVHWPPPAESPKPGGDYCFELAGGDVLFGALAGLDDQAADLDVPRLGR